MEEFSRVSSHGPKRGTQTAQSKKGFSGVFIGLATLRAEPLLFFFALSLLLGKKHMYRKKRLCLQDVA